MPSKHCVASSSLAEREPQPAILRSMPQLALVDLSKRYNQTEVIQKLSLRVAEGEFLTLLGPSGCGKSTLLRIIAGLDQPTTGQVRLGEREITALHPGERDMAMVFQSYALYPHLTVFDNLASPLQVRKLSRAYIYEQVTRIAKRLDLADLLDRKPAQLSGGQRQRVALGRALVRDPQVFLLDEPLSNLDAQLREQVRTELKELFNNQAAPVIYVTHDQTEALTLSTRIAVVSQGQLQQLATPQEIYRYPANLTVAQFIGSPRINLLTVPCLSGQAILGPYSIPCPGAGTLITLGIRPEDLVPNPEAQMAYQVSGQVTLSEDLGIHSLVTVRIAADPALILRVLIPRGQTWGATLTLGLPLEYIHWFDPISGMRLGLDGHFL